MRLNTVCVTTLLLCCHLLPLHAQEDAFQKLLTEAEETYQIGRIEEAWALLEGKVSTQNAMLRLRGYRLLSLCCLALDQTDKARMYAELMLREDSYYTPTVDYPPRFVDMVNDIKRGLTTTITTASSQEESLAEVPVPTTLITEEMIHNSGARNLQEVLAAYVPGMNLIDCNDDINVAMRGIYSNGQEKILIMLNGHRLNSYATNVATPDFSISLEKIRQIEVLRGPASSIYGGVALTAVVNLITKQGADVDGVRLKAGAGNYGQLRADILFGKRYFDLDLLLWGSLYRTSGEELTLDMEKNALYSETSKATIGRIGEKPSYDLGFQLSWKGLRFLYNTRFSQVISPFVISTIGDTYDHDRYRTYNGISPSFATNAQHLDLSYSRQLGKLNLNGTVTYDRSDFTRYQVIYDYGLRVLADIFPTFESEEHIFSEYGVSRYINAQEQDWGAKMRGDFCYLRNALHQGSIVFGAEYNRFSLDDIRYQYGYNFTETMPESTLLRESVKGHETSFDAFLQLKHKWRSLIFNAGLRYDRNTRADGTHLNELSPRVALILSRPKWNAKLSYSKSFVDAPYLYRTLNLFSDIIESKASSALSLEDYTTDLSPERVHSWQLSFAATEWVPGLNFELNAFYNQANDLIVTNVYTYMNGPSNKTAGLELMAAYRHRRFTADFNLTWAHTFKAGLMKMENDFLALLLNSDVDTNNNTPAVRSNAVISWQAAKRLKLFTHLLFESKQSSYNIDIIKMVNLLTLMNDFSPDMDIDDFENDDDYLKKLFDVMDLLNQLKTHDEMSARIICSVGAEYQIGKRLTLGLNVHNLFNTRYDRSGMNTRLVPQRGRWWMASIAYSF